MTADELRAELGRAGSERGELKVRLRDADTLLAELLELAIAHPEVTMTEAVRHAGIGRSMAYKLVREHSGLKSRDNSGAADE